jgi:hypothetical protein
MSETKMGFWGFPDWLKDVASLKRTSSEKSILSITTWDRMQVAELADGGRWIISVGQLEQEFK